MAGLFAAAFFLYQRDDVGYDLDESGWARATIMTARLLMAGDLSPVSWELPDAWSYGNLNPPMGKALFVAAAILRWPLTGEAFPQPPNIYYTEYTYAYNLKQGNVAEDNLRNPLRLAAVFGAACMVVALAGILHLTVGPWGALFGGVLLTANPTLIRLANQVMTDVPYNLCFLLTLLLTIWACASHAPCRLKWRWRAAALAAGMASAVKLAAVFSLTPFLLLVALLLAWRGRVGRGACARMMMEVLLLYGVVAVGLNPYLWPDPSHAAPGRIAAEWRLLTEGRYSIEANETPPRWLTSMEAAGATPGQHQLPAKEHRLLLTRMEGRLFTMHTYHAPYHPLNVVPGIYGIARPLLLPIAYLRWAELKDRFHERHVYQPPSNLAFFKYLGLWQMGFPLESALAGAGLLAIAGIAMDNASRTREQVLLVLLLYVVMVAVMIYLTRLTDHDRYLFPILVGRALLAGAALGIGARSAMRWAAARSAPASAHAREDAGVGGEGAPGLHQGL